MPQKRQLAAIMFTDIEGYTALMQEDEVQAIHVRATHREIFSSVTNKYNGKILQYYGDGTLSIFDSAINAVHCGIEMQLAFQKGSNPVAGKVGIPVRIGIHLGDIIYSEEDIIGDSVNIASRIESLAISGSVFISDKIFDEIKNQASIEVQSMGWFELKNVKKPIEVFAISNDGLIVPDPNQVQGKARKVATQDSLIRTLWNRGQLQMIGGYFIGVWGIITFTDWILRRFQISPYWTDVLLILFLALTPSLLLFVRNKGRLRERKKKLLERFVLPGNLILSIVLLFFLFNGTDLGSTTKTLQFNDENGVEQFQTIIKPGFRKKLAIYNFTPEKKDSTQQWMKWGIHGGIAEDITQNEYLTISTWDNIQSLQEMLSLAKENHYSHCLTGSYLIDGENFQISTKLYHTQSGALRNKHTFKSRDFFALLDTISLVTKKDLGFTRNQTEQFVDLPFSEAFTSDFEAFQSFSRFFQIGDIHFLENAIALDSTFALANYVMASYQYGWSFSLLGAKEAIKQGMRHRKRLPETWRSKMKRLYFQIYDQPDKAIALLKIQMELNPENQNLKVLLTDYLFLTTQYEELLTWRKKLATDDPNPGTLINLAEALLLNRRFEEAGQTLEHMVDQNPNVPSALASLISFYALTTQIDKADSLLQKVMILDPEVEPLAAQYLEAFQYAKNNPQTSESLKKYAGLYRFQHRAAKFDISSIENLLFGKGRTQMGGFFFIPSNEDEFTKGSAHVKESWHFVKNASGRYYKINIHGLRRDQQTYSSTLWRQDSLIEKAMGLFSFNKKEEALDAFRMAYKHNPQHFYLSQYIQHLEFVLNPNNKNALNNMKNYVGRYGPRHIWMEHNKIFYRREGQVSTQQLLPLSPDRFYFWGGFQYQMQVVVENGKVKGTVSWEYNNATGEFERDDNDYIAFDKVKD